MPRPPATLPGNPDSVGTSARDARTAPPNACHSETNIRTIAMIFSPYNPRAASRIAPRALLPLHNLKPNAL
jgi:hypothetical protein